MLHCRSLSRCRGLDWVLMEAREMLCLPWSRCWYLMALMRAVESRTAVNPSALWMFVYRHRQGGVLVTLCDENRCAVVEYVRHAAMFLCLCFEFTGQHASRVA